MLDHLAIGVRDLAASRAFYEAALAPLGFAVVMERAFILDMDGNNAEAVCHTPA